MSYTIVNLTLSVVNEKINQLLLAYPAYPDRQAFSAPDLRQKLEAYVSSRLPSRYVTLEESQACSLERPSKCYSEEQLQQIEALVEQGIASLRDLQSQRPQSSERRERMMVPSSWFG